MKNSRCWPFILTCLVVAGTLVLTAKPSFANHPLKIAGVGNGISGNEAAAQICSSGDLVCTYTNLSGPAYNAMTVAQLRAAFDVLIFEWFNSNVAINADWNTRLVPYMNLGGGILFEDPGNVGDLSPGVTGSIFGAASPNVITSVPGLTDGIVASFANNHISFTAWDPALSPFIFFGSTSGTVVGLWGAFGSGCIVLTGPDQHFHGSRANNQYKLLLNEVNFVSHGCGEVEFSWDLKFCSLPNAFNCKRTRGNVPLTIFGSDDLDVSQIDQSSLRLALASNPGTATGAPASSLPPGDRGSPGDVDNADTCVFDDASGLNVENPDTFLDLDVGFSAAEVASLVCPIAKKSDSAPLIVTGTLLDGTPLKAVNTQVLRN